MDGEYPTRVSAETRARIARERQRSRGEIEDEEPECRS
jgi:hypothetical protein